MKDFNSTKFFRALQMALQTGIDCDAKVLKTGFDEFVQFLFHENVTLTDMASNRQILICARVELSCFTQVLGKKCGRLS